jgi:hypothetical protein
MAIGSKILFALRWAGPRLLLGMLGTRLVSTFVSKLGVSHTWLSR